jgi:3-dehydroquinate synthase
MIKTLNVNVPGNNYNIVIEKGLLKNLGSEIRKVYDKTKIAVITDSNLYGIYGNNLYELLSRENFNSQIIVIKPGEVSKSLNTLEYVYSKLASFNITRSDLIVAFGGGVVGDLAGFAASTYLRGINFIQVPTSLLSQIDSSVGGKTAINLKEGKNLAGTFYHPLKVLTDPDILISLPEKYMMDGLGEAIKYACIKDESLFSMLMSLNTKKKMFNNIERLIYKCCSIKKDLVETDEKDKGQRMLLNFGHTIGHAIEKCTDFRVSHGRAVSAGMLYIVKNSEKLKITEPGTYEKIKNLLDFFNINYNFSDLNINDIKKYIVLDKKNLSGEINLILLRKIGNAFIKKIPICEIDEYISI